GLVITQHGSWNRSPRSGYRVLYLPFQNGMPTGDPIVMVDGFLNEQNKARGRPVGVAIDNRGAVLIADDVGNTVWRVTSQ
ncbi:MAG: sorbosone dehydrogenase family protein, partial [Gammaproteobacteria bacterium]|nr:sorbosone dehydrogenase family protein [Gammaproteobacteria bacterium]